MKPEVDGTTHRIAMAQGKRLHALSHMATSLARRNQDLLAKKDVYEPQRGLRILVVEGEPQLARMASLVLTQRGREVVISPSGEDALKKLQRARFQLILSDVGLGSDQDGWDLAETVRERWPGTHFVLVAGWSAAIDPQEARMHGVHEVLAKPYRIADLRQVANRVAGGLDNEEI